MIRKIAAHYVFPISSPPVKFGIIVCSNQGEIIDVVDNEGNFRERESLEFYDGILVPGFIADGKHDNRAILEDMKQLQQTSSLKLEEIIRLYTLDKAVMNNSAHMAGSFEKQKCPGINLISKIDFLTMRLTNLSEVKALLAPHSDIL